MKFEDPAKQHRFCPPGEHSWCKWQQDLASGTKTYKGDDCLPEVFLELLKPTFMSLSKSKLLERCVRGTTQNPNKCSNSLVCVRCLKHKHHGAKAIRCATASAILHFYRGAESRKEVMERLSISAGSHTSHSLNLKDKKGFEKQIIRQLQRRRSIARGSSLFAQGGKKPCVRWRGSLMKLEAFDLVFQTSIIIICTVWYTTRTLLMHHHC